ncbi:putative Ankyrin repeats (3 copies) [Trypanosoma vivax]|nr:hypothetical protein TRVL_05852 [Trypanosoma vivax]KAH8607212.1 putative Ankyrin repeats (3 copies) [Trypanosoma vivax]
MPPKLCFISPELRALARLLQNLDRRDFPELTVPGQRFPPITELQKLITEIKGRPLTEGELEDFLAVYGEVRYNLRGVDIEVVAESRVGTALKLTSRLDTICTDAGIPLSCVFPCISGMHNFFLEITTLKFSVKLAPVFYRLADVVCGLLQRALEEVNNFIVLRHEAGQSNTAFKLNVPDAHQYVRCAKSDETLLWMHTCANIQEEFYQAFAVIDGDLEVYMLHLRWYVGVCRETIYFDSANFIEDISVRKLWNAYVGKDAPACFAESFIPALRLFPDWSRVPIMDVLNYKGCGVVSLYTLKRLLSVWGPFLLLDRNMQEDIMMGAFDFGNSVVYQHKIFARRPGAAEGDYVLALTETPGELLALVLNSLPSSPSEGNKSGGTASTSLITRRIRLTQQTGAWMVEGLTAEEFDSIHVACRAFPDVFRNPCGTVYNVDKRSPGIPLEEEEFVGDVAHSASCLHRACFRNNERYVKTLLLRGSAVIVNTSVVDPVISTRFCWTPLLCAVNNPNSDPGEVVHMLLMEGADVHIRDDAQCTALYYAIANGYSEAARQLLKHSPHLRPSPWSESLLVALGAHHFHPRESDIRRLCDVLPSAEMLSVILPHQNSLPLVQLCIDIISGKLSGEERMPRPSDDHSLWCPDGDVELRTVEEEKYLADIVRHHSVLCRQSSEEVNRAKLLLYHRCYLLSCREHFKLDKKSNDSSS